MEQHRDWLLTLAIDEDSLQECWYFVRLAMVGHLCDQIQALGHLGELHWLVNYLLRLFFRSRIAFNHLLEFI